MESPESSSHDPLDATEKVPSSWLGDEDLEGPPTLVAPPAPRKPIPSILHRNATAPLAPDVAERIARASAGAPLHLTPVPAPAKPVAIARVQPAKMPAKAAELSTVVHAKARISSEQVVPDSGLWMNDITSRRTIPLRPPAEVAVAAEPAKVEIDWEPPVETVSISESAKVEMSWQPPPVEVAAEPAKVEVDWDPPTDIAPVDVEPPTLDAAVPAPVEPARKAPSRKTKAKRNARRRQPRVAVEPTKMASGSAELPTFGAGMLQSHKVRVKREVAAPAVPASSASTFGAGMLQARKSHAGWIAAAVLVAAALTAAYVGTRGDSKPAAALQK